MVSWSLNTLNGIHAAGKTNVGFNQQVQLVWLDLCMRTGAWYSSKSAGLWTKLIFQIILKINKQRPQLKSYSRLQQLKTDEARYTIIYCPVSYLLTLSFLCLQWYLPTVKVHGIQRMSQRTRACIVRGVLSQMGFMRSPWKVSRLLVRVISLSNFNRGRKNKDDFWKGQLGVRPHPLNNALQVHLWCVFSCTNCFIWAHAAAHLIERQTEREKENVCEWVRTWQMDR